MKIDKNLLVKQQKKGISFLVENSLSEETINRVARTTQFMKRVSKVPPSCFVNTLLFNEKDHANISLPDISADLNRFYEIDVSKEALHKKFTPQACDFIKGLIAELLKGQLESCTASELDLHFPRIKIKDSTKFSLPDTYDGAYAGYGNFSKRNGLIAIQYEYDLVNSDWLSIEVTKGLRNDQTDSKETVNAITKGDLHIRDLGYVTPIYLSAIIAKGAFFLNRLPPNAGVFCDGKQPLNWKKVDASFRKHALKSMELDVSIYEREMLPARLILEKVSDAEYQRRLARAKSSAKSRGVTVTDLYKIKLRYNLFITNVEREILPLAKVRKAYYLRWQIELIFKTWKSFFCIDKIKKVKKERLECQLLAKLLWILINWTLFRTCNQHARKIDINQGVSVIIFFKRCKDFSATFRLVLMKRLSIPKWVVEIFLPLIRDCACEKAKKKTTHYETLHFNFKA